MNIRKMGIVFYWATTLTLPFARTTAQINTQVNLDEAKKAITASNQTYLQAFAKNDVSLFINCYAQDCWIMPPGAPALCGPDAPGDFFKTAYNKLGIRNGKLITIDVYGIGEDVVAEIGFFKLYTVDDVELDDGKFLVLWKRTPDGWKRWRDLFNSSRSNH